MLKSESKIDVDKLLEVVSMKSSKKGKEMAQRPIPKLPAAEPQNSPNSAKASYTKPSQLPIRKGSSLNRSFGNEKASMKSDLVQKQSSLDSGYKGSSVIESVRDSNKIEEEGKQAFKNESLRSSGHSIQNEDFGMSPNASGHHSSFNDRLENFAFSDKQKNLPKPDEKLGKNFMAELRANFKSKYMISNDSVSKGKDDDSFMDRKKTPPPDGGDKLNTGKAFPSTSQVDKSHNSSGGNNIKRSDTVRNNLPEKDGFTSDSDFGGSQSVKENAVRSDRQTDFDLSRLNSSDMDHGYMPGHHIPDGTAYSQRSDYAHMDHKGQLREDVAGVDDVGLAESRGFDVLKAAKETVSSPILSDRLAGPKVVRDNRSVNDKLCTSVQDKSMLVNQAPQNKGPSVKAGDIEKPVHNLIVSTQDSAKADLRSAETQTNHTTDKKMESWTQTSIIFQESFNTESGEISTDKGGYNRLDRDRSTNIPEVKTKHPAASFEHNLLPDNGKPVPTKPSLLTKQSLLKTNFANENLRQDYSMDVLEKIYSGRDSDRFLPLSHSDTLFSDTRQRESLESQLCWHELQGSMDTTGNSPFLRHVQF